MDEFQFELETWIVSIGKRWSVAISFSQALCEGVRGWVQKKAPRTKVGPPAPATALASAPHYPVRGGEIQIEKRCAQVSHSGDSPSAKRPDGENRGPKASNIMTLRPCRKCRPVCSLQWAARTLDPRSLGWKRGALCSRQRKKPDAAVRPWALHPAERTSKSSRASAAAPAQAVTGYWFIICIHLGSPGWTHRKGCEKALVACEYAEDS